MRSQRALAAALLLSLCESAGVFSVLDHGGVGDGATLNTRAFASAVAAAHAYYAATGARGTVLAPASPSPAVYFSGQVALLSGVTLAVEAGARLLASANVSDYPPSAWAFVYARGTVDVGITGGGVLDGNFGAWIAGYNADTAEFVPATWPDCSGECRPRLVQLIDSARVVVSSVSFVGSPDWTFHCLNCTHLHVFNWTQHGDSRWPNNDAIDIDSSSHVLVENATIDTADDGVCIKGSAVNGSSVNVTVRNVRVRSRSSAIKYGSNCPIPMSEHLFEDIEVFDSNRALALQARDGGLLQNITFRRIAISGTRFWPWKWWGDGGPIYISNMLRTPADPGCDIRNVTFEDITAVSQNGATLSGRAPGHTLHGVTLRRVNLTIDRLDEWNYTSGCSAAGGPCNATELSTYSFGPRIEFDPTQGVIPHSSVNTSGWMSGLYVEAVQGLVLEDVHIAFNNQGPLGPQAYWGTACLNLTAAGFPVQQTGGSCTPPVKSS